MKRLLTFLLLSGLISTGFSQLPTHWRGASGNGTYDKSGLMKSWPIDGPEVLWTYEQLGKGHSSPVVSGGFLYVTGMIEETGMLFKFDLEGKLIWKKPYGPEFNSSYTGSRGTPVIVGEKIYLESGTGKLFCLSANDGSILWQKDLFKDFDGSSITQSWFSKKLDSRIGGAVVVDGYIYMSGDKSREWRCVEWETGKEMYASSELGKGVVIYADGMLYCYTDRGELALVKADPSGFKVVSKTKVKMGSEQHWAHPMIHESVLYVRHGSAIIA